jgi:ribosomal protein L40E
MDAEAVVADLKISCVNCGEENDAKALVCRKCGFSPRESRSKTPIVAASAADTLEATATSFFLEFPGWVYVEIPEDGDLLLGRESNSESIDTALAPYVDIHRKHAKVSKTVTGPSVTDLGGENGTWIEESRLTPFEATPITAGQRLRLASSCYLRVTQR